MRDLLVKALELRPFLSNTVLLDYLDLVVMAPPSRGFEITSAYLMRRWCVSRASVSQRINALCDAGLIELEVDRGSKDAWYISKIGTPDIDLAR
jgi:transcription initiation factor IIE alpha subunit